MPLNVETVSEGAEYIRIYGAVVHVIPVSCRQLTFFGYIQTFYPFSPVPVSEGRFHRGIYIQTCCPVPSHGEWKLLHKWFCGTVPAVRR